MHDTLEELRQDHRNVARLMALGRAVLEAMAAGGAADVTELDDIMRYLTGYSDVHHHPTEDIVFERLKARVPDSRTALDAILAEHDDLIRKGRAFLDHLDAARDEAMVRRDRLVEAGKDYFSMLNEHMSTEERELFPLADRALTSEDWDEIDARIERRPDPIFGAALDEQYRRLWQRIQAHME